VGSKSLKLSDYLYQRLQIKPNLTLSGRPNHNKGNKGSCIGNARGS